MRNQTACARIFSSVLCANYNKYSSFLLSDYSWSDEYKEHIYAYTQAIYDELSRQIISLITKHLVELSV